MSELSGTNIDTYRLNVMNQIAGMNPTGQLLFQNGVFKSLGNPAQIVTSNTLQTMNLNNTSTNTPVNTNQKVTVEGFENQSNCYQCSGGGNKFLIILIFLFIILILFLINIKKI